MNEHSDSTYQRPNIERVGTLAELTLVAEIKKTKYIAASPDFHYPAGVPDFNFS